MAGIHGNTKYPPMVAGQRYGRLIAIKFVDRDRKGNQRWLFRCNCGRESIAYVFAARNKITTSCGCRQREVAAATLRTLKTTHGMTNSSEYRIWGLMKNRCCNPNAARFALWGGRGIQVCGRWLVSFENFFADMGPRPSPKYSIDRINNDGNYEPGNCRWATAKDQAHNRRPRRP